MEFSSLRKYQLVVTLENLVARGSFPLIADVLIFQKNLVKRKKNDFELY